MTLFLFTTPPRDEDWSLANVAFVDIGRLGYHTYRIGGLSCTSDDVSTSIDTVLSLFILHEDETLQTTPDTQMSQGRTRDPERYRPGDRVGQDCNLTRYHHHRRHALRPRTTHPPRSILCPVGPSKLTPPTTISTETLALLTPTLANMDTIVALLTLPARATYCSAFPRSHSPISRRSSSPPTFLPSVKHASLSTPT